MFWPHLDMVICVWKIFGQNIKSLQKTDCCNVLSDFLLELHSAIYLQFPLAAAAAAGLLTEPQTAGEIVFFLSFQPVYVFFYKKKK